MASLSRHSETHTITISWAATWELVAQVEETSHYVQRCCHIAAQGILTDIVGPGLCHCAFRLLCPKEMKYTGASNLYHNIENTAVSTRVKLKPLLTPCPHLTSVSTRNHEEKHLKPIPGRPLLDNVRRAGTPNQYKYHRGLQHETSSPWTIPAIKSLSLTIIIIIINLVWY